jgi:hypothetical protein
MTMQIEIFTEDSGTTADPESVQQVKDYFKGGFLPVMDLANEIGQSGDVTIHILSGEHGYLLGSDDVSKLNSSGDDGRSQVEFERSLLQASSTADIIVVLLTTTTFEEIVTSEWENLVSNADQDSIWCFGASKGALSSVDIEQLESRVNSVVLYQRVGVARINTETRQELIDAVMKRN